LAGISYYLSSRSLIRSMNATTQSIGTDYANRIQGNIQERTNRLEDLASTPAFQNGSDKAQIVGALSEAKARLGIFEVIFFISLDGSGMRFDGSIGQHNDRDYFKKVVETKKTYVSNPLISKTTGKFAVNISVPVLRNGQLMGVLGGSCSLKKLSEMVGNLRFMDSGFGYLADSSGLLIAHPRTELVGKLKLTESKVDSALNLSQTDLDIRLINLFNVAEHGKQIQGIYTYLDGVSHSAVFTPIELPGEKHWVMMVTVPELEVNSAAAILAQTVAVLSLIFIIVAVISIVIFSKRFARPITLLRDECLLLAQGDFRQWEGTIFSEDELGQLAQGFHTMRNNLRTLLVKVQGGTEQVATLSEELTSSAQQFAQAIDQVASSVSGIAEGTENQAAASSRVAALIEQIAVAAERNSVAVGDITQSAISTSSEAEQGQKAVEKAVEQMKQIGQGSSAVHTAINELAKGSQEISEIVNLISTIADQTNLLALNAAIEAARAGEQGQGFAVVAEEVRKLAEESNKAAQRIGDLIQRNQINMDQAVVATNRGAESIKEGILGVNFAGDTFEKIVNRVTYLAEQLNEISASMTEMTASSCNMVFSIREIDKANKENEVEVQTVSAATEEQSASMQEIASASQNLTNLAGELQIVVAEFKF